MTNEKEMLDALDNIEAVVSASDRALVAPTVESLCEEYRKIKQYIEIVLPFIDKIPVYGSKIVLSIRFLMTIADSVCPA